MLKLLIKKQLSELFRGFFYDQKHNKMRSRARTILFFIGYAILLFGVIGAMFFAIAVSLCGPFVSAGFGWLYFSIMGLMAMAIGIFGSIFNTYSALYNAKDNDLLLSLPVPIRDVMIARLSGVYIMGLMFSFMIFAPAMIVYWITVPLTAAAVLGPITLLIAITLFVLALSCALGWIVAKVVSKLKNKSLISVIASLLFIAAYYFVYFRAQQIIQNVLANIGTIGTKIRGAYPIYVIGRAGEGDILSVLILLGAAILLLYLLYRLMSRTFLALATGKSTQKREKYREKRTKHRSTEAALLIKELGRFGASPNYMMNCGLGTIFLLAAAVVMIIKGEAFLALREQFGLAEDAFAAIFTAVLCMVGSMNDMASPSVSLEGKSIWIPQSLPVEPWKVLQAKLRLQLVTTLPAALLTSIIGCFVLRPAAVSVIGMLAAPACFLLLMACFDLFMNLRRPNLTWTNEIYPIKQSLSVMVALFGGWAYTVAAAGGYFLLRKIPGFTASAYLLFFAALSLAVALLLHRWIRTKGARIFAEL